MLNDYNKNIKCTVESCKYRSAGKDYCTLECITVGANECNPVTERSTDCLSFENEKAHK